MRYMDFRSTFSVQVQSADVSESQRFETLPIPP
jgi:hypothetical protein